MPTLLYCCLDRDICIDWLRHAFGDAIDEDGLTLSLSQLTELRVLNVRNLLKHSSIYL
jgi:hypothetical protein